VATTGFPNMIVRCIPIWPRDEVDGHQSTLDPDITYIRLRPKRPTWPWFGCVLARSSAGPLGRTLEDDLTIAAGAWRFSAPRRAGTHPSLTVGCIRIVCIQDLLSSIRSDQHEPAKEPYDNQPANPS